MRIIIAGGRDFDDYKLAERSLDEFINENLEPVPDFICSIDGKINMDDFPIPSPRIEIVSGGARGADKIGERIAEHSRIPCKVISADWDQYGRSAGYRRNAEMADYAGSEGGLLAFWDGNSKGTKHMIDTATRKGMVVKVIRY